MTTSVVYAHRRAYQSLDAYGRWSVAVEKDLGLTSNLAQALADHESCKEEEHVYDEAQDKHPLGNRFNPSWGYRLGACTLMKMTHVQYDTEEEVAL